MLNDSQLGRMPDPEGGDTPEVSYDPQAPAPRVPNPAPLGAGRSGPNWMGMLGALGIGLQGMGSQPIGGNPQNKTLQALYFHQLQQQENQNSGNLYGQVLSNANALASQGKYKEAGDYMAQYVGHLTDKDERKDGNSRVAAYYTKAQQQAEAQRGGRTFQQATAPRPDIQGLSVPTPGQNAQIDMGQPPAGPFPTRRPTPVQVAQENPLLPAQVPGLWKAFEEQQKTVHGPGGELMQYNPTTGSYDRAPSAAAQLRAQQSAEDVQKQVAAEVALGPLKNANHISRLYGEIPAAIARINATAEPEARANAMKIVQSIPAEIEKINSVSNPKAQAAALEELYKGLASIGVEVKKQGALEEGKVRLAGREASARDAAARASGVGDIVNQPHVAFDQVTGEPVPLTKGMLQAGPQQLKTSSGHPVFIQQDAQQARSTVYARTQLLPQIHQMATLGSRIFQKYPNPVVIDAKKWLADPDVKQFMATGKLMTNEVARMASPQGISRVAEGIAKAGVVPTTGWESVRSVMSELGTVKGEALNTIRRGIGLGDAAVVKLPTSQQEAYSVLRMGTMPGEPEINLEGVPSGGPNLFNNRTRIPGG